MIPPILGLIPGARDFFYDIFCRVIYLKKYLVTIRVFTKEPTMKKVILAAFAVAFVGLSLAYTYSDASPDAPNTILGCTAGIDC